MKTAVKACSLRLTAYSLWLAAILKRMKLKKICLWGLVALVIGFLFVPAPLPLDPMASVVYSRDGQLLGARIARDQQWRFPELDTVPEKFEKALLLFEDQHFYYHPGVNPISLMRALVSNIKNGRVVSGGSTITMQLIRIGLNNPARTLWQKSKEIVMALKMDLLYSKEEILRKYSSHAPFGGNVVGLEAASWRYYGRHPNELSWAEAATMAVLPNAPSLIRPGKNMNRLLTKRNRLLKRLCKHGDIDSLQYELSLMEPLPIQPYPLPRGASHMVEHVVKMHPGEKIVSTLDKELQRKVGDIVDRHHKHLSGNEIYNMAAIVVKISTGEVLSYVGNTKSKGHTEHGCDVDIIRAPRSSGSVLKPFLYAMMMDKGEILPHTLVADIPTQIHGYSPKNYNLNYDGAVPASHVISRSLNVPSVRMLQDFGVGRFLEGLRKFQFSHMGFSADHYGLSLILGGAETSLWDLAGAYCSMGRILKNYSSHYARYRKADIHAPVLLKKEVENVKSYRFTDNNQLLEAGAIWFALEAMRKVNRPDNQLGWEAFSSSHNVAWKTGTSFGFRDAWALGLSGEYFVGVWAGNADGEGRPGLTGVTAAAPVMFDIFDLMPKSSWFEKPFEDLESIPICHESGYRASPVCPHVDTLEIPLSGVKTDACPFHHLIHLDPQQRYRVTAHCVKPRDMVHKAWFVLPPAWGWYYKRKNPLYRPLPSFMPGCEGDNDVAMMQFVFPAPGAQIYIPRDLDGKMQQVVFSIAHRHPQTRIFWHLDNQYLGQTQELHQMQLFASSGQHTITAVDEAGNTISEKVMFLGGENN